MTTVPEENTEDRTYGCKRLMKPGNPPLTDPSATDRSGLTCWTWPSAVWTHRRDPLRGRGLAASAGWRTGWPARIPTAARLTEPLPAGSTSPDTLYALPAEYNVEKENPEKQRAELVLTWSADCTSLPGPAFKTRPHACVTQGNTSPKC